MDIEERRQELARVFQRDSERLRSAALRIVRDPTEAEDAVQDGFASAWRSLDAFRGDAQLSTWLHRIVCNAALMRLRSRRRRPECALDEQGENVLPAEAPPPDEVTMRRQLCARMLRAASALDPAVLELLTARYLRDESLRGIAARHRITRSAAKTRMHRARLSLRRAMEALPTKPALAG